MSKKIGAEFSDFQKLDFRVGKVLSAEKVEESENLIKIRVDLGEDYGEKTVLSGVAKWYSPLELLGKKFIFVANLAPKKMMDMISEGMILCADIDGQARIITIDDSIPIGAVVR